MLSKGTMTSSSYTFLFRFIVLSALTIHANSQEHMLDDLCVDRSFQRWYLNMITKFSQYAAFTTTMPSSRTLFNNLLSQDFSADSFKAYCKVHADARKDYASCPDSDAKTSADIEFALADHICIKRAQTFSQNLACLQRYHIDSLEQCKSTCSSYEQGSQRYASPNAVDLRNERMNWIPYMASDCQYLKCLTDCRKPIFKQQCGELAASLETEALQASYAKKIDYYEPPWAREMFRDSIISSMLFPAECQQLADDAIFATVPSAM